MPYRVEIRPAARRQIKKLPREAQAEILNRLSALSDNPRPLGSEVLQGEEGLHRLRAGSFRIIYTIQDEILQVLVVRVGHRREVYRKLPRG